MKYLFVLIILLSGCNIDSIVDDNRDKESRSTSIAWIVSVVEYGNWCGDGHKSGDSLDSLDACCKQHDKALKWSDVSWSACRDDEKRAQADYELVTCAKSLDSDPDKWPVPPTGKYSKIEPGIYRKGLIALFGICSSDNADREQAENIADIEDR
jgi:hypothetical protein